ncbi:MAG: TerC family protein [Planctomycetes bacterium]|nr:TerC family protein [Planctomycetota bacterium]
MNWTVFAIFNLFVVAMLALDLGVFHRKSHAVSVREALSWSGVWIALALSFNALLWLMPGIFFNDGNVAHAVARGELVVGAGLSDYGALRAEQFLAGYLIEKSLSVDNLFVFLLIFTAFAVPAAYQHKLLFYGIVGALVLRAIFIFGGVALIQNFAWIIYIFGTFLIFTGIKMLMPHRPMDPANHWVVRLARRILPVSSKPDGDRFFIVENGKRMVTPLFLVLLVIEFTDVVFAIDSIPAILAITDNVFIVYTSNVFAILGLRSLYFALAGMADVFHYLKYGLSAILLFVGGKMLAHAITVEQTVIDAAGVATTVLVPFKVPIAWSLAVIGSLLALAVIASLMRLWWLRRQAAALSQKA